MTFEKPYSQYNGKWVEEIDDKITYYIIKFLSESTNFKQQGPRKWEVVVLTKPGEVDYYSPKMTLWIAQKQLEIHKPTQEEKGRVFKAIFGEGWIR
jgi:hypothetical protein